MKNKKTILGVVALVLIVALMAGIYLAARPETVAGGKAITVTVVHKDGTEKVFTYQTDEEFLGPVLEAEGLITGTMGQYGMMIDSVDGETADWNVDHGYWAIFIGEEYATTGADGIVVTDGGDYSLVYTIG